MTQKQNGTNGTAQKVMVGAGLAALAAAAAGAIYLYGTEAGKKKRKEVKGWMIKMRGDVVEKMEKMKDWSEEAYHKVIDEVAHQYQNVKKMDAGEVGVIVDDLKKHWRTIKKQVDVFQKPAKKSPAKKAKK